jgi:hypothetical protein
MLINKDNVEAYLLDYQEGNLDAGDEKALKSYLKAHPEYADMLDEEPLPQFTPDTSVVYANKESLKRSANRTKVFYMRPVAFRLAVAAAILALIVSVAIPFLRTGPTEVQGTMQAQADRPEIVIDTYAVTPVEDEEQTHPANEMPRQTPDKQHEPRQQPPVSLIAPPQDYVASNEDQWPRPLVAKSIDRLELQRFTSDERQMKHTLAAAGGPLLPEADKQQVQKPQRKWYTSILNSEVARNFLPEAVQETLPEPQGQEEDTKSKNNVILELPPAGKRLIDAIFKPE